jgi:hypothetical protein
MAHGAPAVSRAALAIPAPHVALRKSHKRREFGTKMRTFGGYRLCRGPHRPPWGGAGS